MQIVDSFKGNSATFVSVELAENRFVDVKCYHAHRDFGDLMYIMQNADGSTVYGYEGKTYPNFPYSTQEVLLLCKNHLGGNGYDPENHR